MRRRVFSLAKPYERLVNYIQSSGTQYINTGFIPTANTKIEFKFSLVSVPTDTYAVFGGSFQTDKTFGFAVFLNNTVNVQARTGTYNYPNMVSSLSVAKDLLYWGSLQFNKFVLNDVEYLPSKLNTWATLSAPFRILSANDYPSRRIISGRVYYFKMYESGELIRDLIPVIDKSGVACLYNRAYKPDGSHGLEFYTNAGTGVFTYA